MSAVVLAILLITLSDNHWVRLIVFLPIFISAINHLQVKNKFCVSYAAAGLQNALDGSEQAENVSVEEQKQDRAKARKMNLQALGISLLFTAFVVVV